MHIKFMPESFLPARVDRLGRLLVPHLFLVVLMLVGLISYPLPYVGPVKPFFVLMPVYYWAIYRPTLMPSSYCFVIGLVVDLLAGTALGLHSFILVAVQWLARDQRRFLMGQTYIVIWLVYALVVFFAAASEWALVGLMYRAWSSPVPGAFSALFNIFLFPFVSLLLSATHRMLPVSSKTYP